MYVALLGVTSTTNIWVIGNHAMLAKEQRKSMILVDLQNFSVLGQVLVDARRLPKTHMLVVFHLYIQFWLLDQIENCLIYEQLDDQ